MHQYKVIAYADIDGTRREAAFRYADSPAQALQFYDEYSGAKNEEGNALYSLVTLQVAVYKTAGISDFRKLYT